MKRQISPVLLEDGDRARIEYDEHGINEVVKIPQGRCLGCLNISKSNFPISFNRNGGFGELTTEHQYEDFEGNRVDTIKIHFCPICGRKIIDLVNDTDYPPPWGK